MSLSLKDLCSCKLETLVQMGETTETTETDLKGLLEEKEGTLRDAE